MKQYLMERKSKRKALRKKRNTGEREEIRKDEEETHEEEPSI